MAEGLLEVVIPGFLTTIQDLGRPGYARYGLAPGGAADEFAFRAANLLVDNPPEAAGLEITMIGPELRFLRSTSFAVTGADLQPTLDGAPVPGWRGVWAGAGQTLRFGSAALGLRAYLGISGGVAVPLRLGSRSSDERSGLGWRDGRPLAAGDVLEGAGATVSPARLDGLAGLLEGLLPPGDASVTDYLARRAVSAAAGPQADCFPAAARRVFWESTFVVGTGSDRTGLRLEGPRVTPARPDIVSDGLVTGAVQVPGDGRPVCLLSGRQTTGGYPKIAVVGRAHLRVTAQRPLLSALAFVRAEAAELEDEAAAYLQTMRAWEEARRGEVPARLYRSRSGPVVSVQGRGTSTGVRWDK